MRLTASIVLLFCLSNSVRASIVVDFESLPVNDDGFYNGDIGAAAPLRDNYTILGSAPGPFGGTDYSQQWSLGGVEFSNIYNSDFDSWLGLSWSNVVDRTTGEYANQYASYPGGGADGSAGTVPGGMYAVAHAGGYMNLPSDIQVVSMDIANTTYTALAMQDGYLFAKKFGGSSGNDPDFFRVILSGFEELNGLGDQIGSVTVDLADYTFADNGHDYILDNWLNVDLSAISNARSIGFSFESSDSGEFGINTPAYFAIDNLTFTAVPEPSTVMLFGMLGVAATCFRRQRPSARHRPDQR